MRLVNGRLVKVNPDRFPEPPVGGPWRPMLPAVRDAFDPAKAVEIAAATGYTVDAVLAATNRGGKLYMNDWYTCEVTPVAGSGEGPDMVHLSIKRNDRKPVTDWRHVQLIKNDVLGPECEAIQVFPAESRLVDGANQYHLWGFTDPSVRLGFGFNERHVSESTAGGVGQRPWHPEDRPGDLR